MTRFPNLLAAVAVSSALFVAATSANAQMHDHAGHNMASATQGSADTALSKGEIKNIDRDTGKLTIQHGPLANLNMPGMTMAYKAQDSHMLDQVQVGDTILFRVEKLNGSFVVTKLESAN